MLSILGLTQTYPGGVTALNDVSLEVPSGLFGLLGPNGSGKTTLMRILAGLLAPTAGTIRWDGQDITQTPERIWPVLGYLPQDFGFYSHMTGDAMLRRHGRRAARRSIGVCACGRIGAAVVADG